MAETRVVVCGTGYMGREVLAAVGREPDLVPVGVIEKFAESGVVELPVGGSVPLGADPAAIIESCRPDVVVDFTNAAFTPLVARSAIERGVRPVIGTTGLEQGFIDELASLCRDRRVGAFVAPNFAIGAVLMIQLARIAAPFFDYAEITEMHQEKKVDAPSGTAVATAREMVAARGRPFLRALPEKETLPGARGAEYEGVSLHSQRMPGFVAHQEVALGGLGQTLRIRHDSTGRDSFIPGVLLAVRRVLEQSELVVGLDKLIGL
jgi:4-hydroxy-tetrahydrodipicolinate reductase